MTKNHHVNSETYHNLFVKAVVFDAAEEKIPWQKTFTYIQDGATLSHCRRQCERPLKESLSTTSTTLPCLYSSSSPTATSTNDLPMYYWSLYSLRWSSPNGLTWRGDGISGLEEFLPRQSSRLCLVFIHRRWLLHEDASSLCLMN